MSSTSSFLAVLVVALLALNVAQFYYWTQVHEEEEEVLNIQDIFEDDWEDFIGQDVTVQGYYINASGPMLVSNLDLVMINLQMPNDSYLPLTGDVDINDTEYGGAFVQVDGTVQAVNEESARDVVLKRPVLEFISVEVIIKPIFPYYVKLPDFVVTLNISEISRYAVLISGGVDVFNNHYRYWNDMKFMYSILVNGYGYDPANIYVIYANGIGRDTDMPVNYSATFTNVQTVFNELQTKMKSEDTLFLYTNDHGSGFWPTDPYGVYVRGARVDTDTPGTDETLFYSETSFDEDFNGDGDKFDLVAFDEGLNLWGNQMLYDDELASMLDELEYYKMIIVMEQCFSGGFVRDLSGPFRIILTACAATQPSYSADTEGNYNEFTYHFMSAVNWETPTGVAVDADLDNNGWVTMEEAFNYASDHDSRDEIPTYDDNGDGVGYAAPIPGGTPEGGLGSNTHL